MKTIAELNICKDIVCAIEYNDLSNISEEEETLIAEFQARYAGCIFQWGDEDATRFTSCDILCMPADCVTLTVIRI